MCFCPDNTIWKDLNTNEFFGNQCGGEEFSIDCFEIFFRMLPKVGWKYVWVYHTSLSSVSRSPMAGRGLWNLEGKMWSFMEGIGMVVSRDKSCW